MLIVPLALLGVSLAATFALLAFRHPFSDKLTSLERDHKLRALGDGVLPVVRELADNFDSFDNDNDRLDESAATTIANALQMWVTATEVKRTFSSESKYLTGWVLAFVLLQATTLVMMGLDIAGASLEALYIGLSIGIGLICFQFLFQVWRTYERALELN